MSNAYIPTVLRRLVSERAGGRCEYCLIPETAVFAAHEIDHSISQKHGGPTEADNLALSCALCNKHKGSDLVSLDPDTDHIVPLYDPRRDRWSDHFQLRAAQFVPLTPTGRVTVRL
jgi:5-methylcytosine-specific restriction endonuclease McrA